MRFTFPAGRSTLSTEHVTLPLSPVAQPYASPVSASNNWQKSPLGPRAESPGKPSWFSIFTATGVTCVNRAHSEARARLRDGNTRHAGSAKTDLSVRRGEGGVVVVVEEHVTGQGQLCAGLGHGAGRHTLQLRRAACAGTQSLLLPSSAMVHPQDVLDRYRKEHELWGTAVQSACLLPSTTTRISYDMSWDRSADSVVLQTIWFVVLWSWMSSQGDVPIQTWAETRGHTT